MLMCMDCFCWNCVRDAEAEVDRVIRSVDYVYLVVIGIIPLAVDTLEGGGGTIP